MCYIFKDHICIHIAIHSPSSLFGHANGYNVTYTERNKGQIVSLIITPTANQLTLGDFLT